MKTLSYIKGTREDIAKGETYYFGQLWDGTGDGEELLKSGCIAVWSEEDREEKNVDFETVEEAGNILETVVRVL